MFSRTEDRRPTTGFRRLLLLCTLVAGLVFVSAGRSDEGSKEGSVGGKSGSVSFVPADTAFYAALTNNKKQVDLFYNSNAYKSLRNSPLLKQAIKMAMAELHKEGGPGEKAKDLLEDKENKELLEVLTEAVSDDVFVYGGKNWTDLYTVLMQMNNANSLAPLQSLLAGENDQKAGPRAMLLTAQKQRELIRIPDTVFGFKLKDTKKATAQLGRLEKFLTAVAGEFAPLKGKIKRTKVAGGDFLVAEADGSLIPWKDVDLSEFEKNKDEFKDLIDTLKKQTLTVSLGVKGDYLLLGFTADTKALEKLGGPKSLASRDELKPLAKFAKNPITGIGYSSQEFVKSVAGASGDIDAYAKLLKDALETAPMLKEERKKAIVKDLDEYVAAAKKLVPQYGAQFGFSFLTEAGYEAYDYNYTKSTDPVAPVDATKLLTHLGGDPILGAAFAMKFDGSGYKATVKFAKMIYGHLEAFALDIAPPEAKDEYEKFKKNVFPALGQLDSVIVKDLLPSLGDSGLGLILDAKWKSKQWSKELPAMPKEMPMLELGLLLGVSDADKFAKACKDVRLAINEIIDKIGDTNPAADNIKLFKIPAPESEKGTAGRLVFYPIPKEAALDEQVQPVAGIGKSASVVTFSKKHAERLLTPTPLKMKSKPLARKEIVGGSVFDWSGLVDAATPWVEFGLETALPKEKLPIKPAEIKREVKTLLTVMKCMKGSSSATFREDGVTVTHSELQLKDLDKATEPD